MIGFKYTRRWQCTWQAKFISLPELPTVGKDATVCPTTGGGLGILPGTF